MMIILLPIDHGVELLDYKLKFLIKKKKIGYKKLIGN